jgi:NNP family nitrate/nitrite transporter-like MFS transporter
LLSDKLGGIRMLMLLYGSVAVLLFCVAQLPALVAAVALFFLIMGCLGMGNGAVFQLVPQRFGDRVGVITGIVGAAGGVGGFFLPTILGWLKEVTGSYGTGLSVFGIVAVAAFVMLLAVQREWIGLWVAKDGRVLPGQEAEPA